MDFIHMPYLVNKRPFRIAPLLRSTVKTLSQLSLSPCKLQFPMAQLSDLEAPKGSIKMGYNNELLMNDQPPEHKSTASLC
jgi:hypothetical protein